MKGILLVSLVLILFDNACSDLWKAKSQPKASAAAQEPCATRYVPVGNTPEIALDTETGTLCRTISDTNDPLGVLDSTCGVTAQEKKLGFVPNGCKGGQTWVKGEGDKNPSRYRNLGRCSDVIVVTDDDMKKAGVK